VLSRVLKRKAKRPIGFDSIFSCPWWEKILGSCWWLFNKPDFPYLLYINIDIEFSAHDAPSPCTLTVKIFESHLIQTSLGVRKPKDLQRIVKIDYGHLYRSSIEIKTSMSTPILLFVFGFYLVDDYCFACSFSDHNSKILQMRRLTIILHYL